MLCWDNSVILPAGVAEYDVARRQTWGLRRNHLGDAAAGQLKVQEDVIDGLENTPRALIGLLAGENRGKRMVRVG